MSKGEHSFLAGVSRIIGWQRKRVSGCALFTGEYSREQ